MIYAIERKGMMEIRHMDTPTAMQELSKRFEHLEAENEWMRREIERVGVALYTNAEGHYTGTEEDLHCIGQTVEGVCDTMFQLETTNADLLEALELVKRCDDKGFINLKPGWSRVVNNAIRKAKS